MKTFKLTKIASVLLALSAGTAGAVPLNLVQNGGFEITPAAHSIALAPTGAYQESAATGWYNYAPGGFVFNALYMPGEATTLGATGIGSYALSPPAVLWAAIDSPTGGNFIASDGDSTVASEISQIITGLVIGQTYDLRFDFAGAQFNNRTGANYEGWNVRFGTETHSTPILSNASEGFKGWFGSQMQFTATAVNQALVFMAVGGPDGLPPLALLDSVSLTETPPPPVEVPEPASLALTSLGLAGIAFLRRSRRSTTTLAR